MGEAGKMKKVQINTNRTSGNFRILITTRDVFTNLGLEALSFKK